MRLPLAPARLAWYALIAVALTAGTTLIVAVKTIEQRAGTTLSDAASASPAPSGDPFGQPPGDASGGRFFGDDDGEGGE